jgi:hypothetical protein
MPNLGGGKSGELQKAKLRNSGRIVSIKRIFIDRDEDARAVSALPEIKILKSIPTRNSRVVQLLDTFDIRSALRTHMRP